MRHEKSLFVLTSSMPLAVTALTYWLSHGIVGGRLRLLLGLIALVYAGGCAWADRGWAWGYGDNDGARRLFVSRLAGAYTTCGLWVVAGLVVAGLLRMNPPWLAAIALVYGFMHSRTLVENARASNDGDRVHVRGRKLESAKQIRAKQEQQLTPDGKSITWGGAKVAHRLTTLHFCVSGVSGAGKTVLIRMLMQEVLPDIRPGADTRAMIYDAKRDMASLLAGMRLGCRVHLLNPFDARGVAWDIARDVNDLGPAQEIAAILVPENKQENQPFFGDASRQLLTYLMVAYSKLCPGRWTLRDVILGSDELYLKQILSRIPEAWHRVRKYFEAKELPSVLSTIVSRLSRFEAVAAAWHRAERRISLSEWALEPSILVLGTDPMFEAALTAVNQMLVKRLSQIVLSQSESSERRNWFFLDEFRSAGNLGGLSLSKLLTEGRSKGVAVVIGFQDFNGLKDAYGDNLPAELTGQCNHKAFLRIEDPETAQWAAKCIGEQDLKETTRSSSTGASAGGGTWNQTVDERTATRPTVMADEIRSLPPAGDRHGLSGYYTSPFLGAWHFTHPGSIFTEVLLPPDRAVPDFVARDAPQTIPLWDKADLTRLNLEFLQDVESVGGQQSQPATAPNPRPAPQPGESATATGRPKHSLWAVARVTPPPHRASPEFKEGRRP